MAIRGLLSVTARVVLLVLCLVQPSHPHGFLKEPPSRSSMWCLGYDTPPNYNHNELNCGGWQHLVGLGGKCGFCGDPFDGIRRNEAGGTYAQGVITRLYKPGDIIPIVVNLTATHGGYFEFKMCANNDVNTPVTQSCLDEHVLAKADNSGETKYTGVPYGGYTNPVYIEMLYRLPMGVTCQQCVIQWKYTAAQNVGYPIQEEFYGCADIAIASDLDPQPFITLPRVSSVTCSVPEFTTRTTFGTKITPVSTAKISQQYSTTRSTKAPTSRLPSRETTTTPKSTSVDPPSTTSAVKQTSISAPTTSTTTTTTTRISPTQRTTTPSLRTTVESNITVDTLTFDILYKRCKAKGVLEGVFTDTCRMLCSLPKSCLKTFCNASCILLEKYIV